LVVRNTEQAYWDYVKELAQAAGIDPNDDKALRQFDRKRPGKKLSNEQFKNRHDADAKISRQKGKTDLIYKPENSVDMDSGVIIQAQLAAADKADSVDLAQRIDSVQQCLERLDPTKKIEAVVADGNYHSLANLCALQKAGLKVVIAENRARRAKEEHLTKSERQALRKARRTQQSKSGRRLMRMRGQHIERTFAHILDCGGMRKATLRGQVNLQKRYNFAAACYNFSQLLRKKFGCGTLKMAQAIGRSTLFAHLVRHWHLFRAYRQLLTLSSYPFPVRWQILTLFACKHQGPGISTVC
jgi:phosphoglycolate phosphatase-like HAD superfamily hydrolase